MAILNRNTLICCSTRGVELFLMMMLTLLLAPNSVDAFRYNSYEHFSYANCSVDRESVPPMIFCDIPTGDNGRKPTNLSGVVLYSHDFEGDVMVCARRVTTGLNLCASKHVSVDGKVVFDTHDLNFNWGSSPWWDWVLSIKLWDTELSSFSALRGYKVFYNIP